MYISKIYLKGFKNLALTNIEELEYNTDTPLQLILGQNGSGKSSILRELSPLPAIPANYNSGGIKEVFINHNGSEYKLRSVVNGSAKHSFIKDGIELNPGNGTGVVQKELVEREFNYTPVIQKLLTGEIQFTKMAPNQRRELLTSISDLKLDYVLSIYNRLKQSHRDSVGAIKHVKGKLENLNTELMLMGELEKLSSESKMLTDEIKRLIPLSVNNKVYPDTLLSKLNTEFSKLNSLIQKCKNTRVCLNTGSLSSIADTNEWISKLEKEKYALGLDIDKTLAEIAEVSKLTSVIENTDNGVDILKSNLKELINEYNNTPFIEGVVYEIDLKTVINTLKAISSDLYEVHIRKDDDMLVCNLPELNSLNDEKRILTEQVNKLSTNYNFLSSKLEEAIQHRKDAINCPKCNTIITMGEHLNDTQLSNLEARVKSVETELNTLKPTLDELTLKMDKCNRYIDHYRTIRTCTQQYGGLFPFWKETEGLTWVVNNTIQAVDALRKEIYRVERNNRRLELEKEIKSIKETISLYELAESSNACHKRSLLEESLDKMYARQTKVNTNLEALNKVKVNYELLKRMEGDCTLQEEIVSKVFLEWVNTVAHDTVGNEILRMQQRLGDIQGILRKKEHLCTSLEELTNDHDTLKADYEAYTALVNELSPTTGLIAEQMRGYLECFMDQVNTVISNIWEYPLSVEVCGFEEGGLDYKFPINVSGRQIPDISKGSAGIQDIIDFAFTIVTMGYMGLNDYPLYMDEVGSSFDHKHRSNLIKYIKLLLESRQCTQLFMVNHFSADYGGLTHTNVLALSENNVILPDVYNTNTRIVYG